MSNQNNQSRLVSKREVWSKSVAISKPDGELPGFDEAIKSISSIFGPDAIESIEVKTSSDRIKWERDPSFNQIISRGSHE